MVGNGHAFNGQALPTISMLHETGWGMGTAACTACLAKFAKTQPEGLNCIRRRAPKGGNLQIVPVVFPVGVFTDALQITRSVDEILPS